MDEDKKANGQEPFACDPDVSTQDPEKATEKIASTPEIRGESSPQCAAQVKKPRRKDTGRLHAMRHGMLSRHLLEALRRLGENMKVLRRLEKRLRTAFKVAGVVKELIFDKYWCAHLRGLLAVRIEAMAVAPLAQPADRPISAPSLVGKEVPTLVYSDAQDRRFPSEVLFGSVLRDLCLIQRYAVHFGKEEMRWLALLLVSLNDGEEGLAESIAQMLGINPKTPEG